MDSDGTLILNLGELKGGTLQTVRFAEMLNKPYRLIQLENIIGEHKLAQTTDWLVSNMIKTLNVAGPRESKSPNIYNESCKFLNALFSYIQLLYFKDSK